MPNINHPITQSPIHSLRVGITGGIGSGKSMVCQMLHFMGVPIYYADIRAKWILSKHPAVIAEVKKLFGEEAYLPDGAYNRPFVAKMAFANPEKLAALNAIVHPAVEADSRAWHEALGQIAPYTVKEAALMIESGSHRFLDKLVVVTAPEAVRLARVVARDGMSEADVRRRMANQLPESEKLQMADFVIQNDGRTPLIPQVVALHRALLALAEKK